MMTVMADMSKPEKDTKGCQLSNAMSKDECLSVTYSFGWKK